MALRLKKFSRVLVTGGAGFIGSHLVDRLMRMDCFVRVVDNLIGGSLDNVRVWVDNRRFEFVRGDLKDSGVAEQAVDGVEVVFHLVNRRFFLLVRIMVRFCRFLFMELRSLVVKD